MDWILRAKRANYLKIVDRLVTSLMLLWSDVWTMRDRPISVSGRINIIISCCLLLQLQAGRYASQPTWMAWRMQWRGSKIDELIVTTDDINRCQAQQLSVADWRLVTQL